MKINHINQNYSRQYAKSAPGQGVSFGSIPGADAIRELFKSFNTRGLRPLSADIFSPSVVNSRMDGIYGRGNFSGRIVKNISLKNVNGKNIKGFILQDTENENRFYACTKEKALCRMEIKNDDDAVFIIGLFGQGHDGEYKGAGTELIKFAVEKSKQEGFKGRLNLHMAGSFPFYFKNNFRSARGCYDPFRHDALLDYMTRHNLELENIIETSPNSPTIVLDEKGANSLLDGRRFFEESTSETMYEKTIEHTSKRGKKYTIDADIDFSDLSKLEPEGNIYVVQIFLKSGNKRAQIANLQMELLQDENDKKYLKATKINIEKNAETFKKELEEELFAAAKLKVKDFGAEFTNNIG